MHHVVAELLQTYGYSVLFLFTLIEGETVVILAGFAAHQHYLRLGDVIVIATIGATLGDQFFFLFGRWKGRKYLERRPEMAQRIAYVVRLLGKYQNLFILGSRFMYGFRMLIPATLGATKISFKRFFVLNILGAALWSILFANVGFLFGDAIEAALGKVKRFEEWVFILIIIAGIVVARIMVKKRERARDDGENDVSTMNDLI